jgi:hypothetical protein
VLTTIVVLVGLGILRIFPSYDQPGIRFAASGTSPRCLISELGVFPGLNTDLSAKYRNPVPFYAEGGTIASELEALCTFPNVYGYAVNVDISYADQYAGCD